MNIHFLINALIILRSAKSADHVYEVLEIIEQTLKKQKKILQNNDHASE